MVSKSLEIVSNQQGVHDRLQDVVLKHLQQPFQKPISSHTQEVFDRSSTSSQFKTACYLRFLLWCGRKHQNLAKRHPDCFVIGLDKSAIDWQNMVLTPSKLLFEACRFE